MPNIVGGHSPHLAIRSPDRGTCPCSLQAFERACASLNRLFVAQAITQRELRNDSGKHGSPRSWRDVHRHAQRHPSRRTDADATPPLRFHRDAPTDGDKFRADLNDIATQDPESRC